MEIDTPAQENCRLGPGPFVFSGTPPLIQGVVSLVNESADKLKVRSLRLNATGLQSARVARPLDAKAKAQARQPEDLLKVKVLQGLIPYAQANVIAMLNIDKFTAPGEYQAQVRLADQQAPALLIVLPHYELRLIPDRMTIAAAPGETIKRSVYVVNEGNVPFSTRKAAFAPLQALNMLHHALAIALNEEGHKGHKNVLDRLASELADAEVQPAKVKIEVQDLAIAPGETKEVEITIRLPADLKQKRTYTSRIRFRKAKLAIELDVNGNPDKPKERSR